MKILFMGTPDFAAEILAALDRTDNEIVGAVSQEDKPKGRGHKLMPTDVKVKAQELGIKVFQPQTLRDKAFLPTLDELKPDMIVVAAYGRILPEYIINYPKYGCINVHASILPKYRGAAPIQWAVINGDKTTGVSIMKMDKGLDTGDVIAVAETPIGEYETCGELFDRLAQIGGKLLTDTIPEIESGNAVYTPQNDSDSTYAPKITKETSVIDWNCDCGEVSKLICGMNPFPGAVTEYDGVALKVYEAEKTDGDGMPGEILGMVKNKGLRVACKNGAVFIKTVQFSGSKRMNIEDYARGHKIVAGTVLGNSR